LQYQNKGKNGGYIEMKTSWCNKNENLLILLFFTVYYTARTKSGLWKIDGAFAAMANY
jgi:hypothetical protein